jgi:hypothetical protein
MLQFITEVREKARLSFQKIRGETEGFEEPRRRESKTKEFK